MTQGSAEQGQATEEQGGPVIRDKRRIDPTTGAVREPVDPAPAGAAAAPADQPEDVAAEFTDTLDPVAAELAERTADLQRLSAEYANYRKRVDRDRVAVRDQALGAVLTGLLPVLDDFDRAAQHGELVGGFKAVADAIDGYVTKLGLTRFGEAGEPFDPTVHEALTHTYSDEVTQATAVAVLQPGYRIGERVLRPARVAVAEPE